MVHRVWAAAEVTLVMGAIFAIIWVVKPQDLPGVDLSLRILVGAMLLLSPWLHHDSRERLGVRLDNFLSALAAVLPVSLVALSVAGVAGYLLGTIDPPENPAGELADYFMWAVAQQYALQSVVLLRLEDAGLRKRAPLIAAALFSAVHAPNPGLMILTFLGSLLWCSTFSRRPNIFALALSHAVLAVVVVSVLPREVTGGYRIGPAYWSG
jgi:membrane protease YdiL (CAAX protease family)